MKDANGYSLVELLVVLALIGLITLGIAGGIRFGSKAWDVSGAKVETIEQIAGSQALLRNLLQHLVPRELDPARQDDPYLFQGSTKRMSFAAIAPMAWGATGVERFELAAQTSAQGETLTLKMSRLRKEGAPTVETLLEGAGAIEFRFARLDQTGRLEWTDNWSGETGAPSAIAIVMKFDAKSHKHWPEFIVRPRISRDPSCLYDPVSFSCRRA